MAAAHLAVVLAAVAFGRTFVPVQDAVRRAGPVPFLAVRFLLGAAVLAAYLGLGGRGRWLDRPTLLAGLRCGIPLWAGYVLQTVGLRYTTTSVSAFVTYLLVVMVPVLAALEGRRLPAPGVAAGVVLATAGLFLLTGAHLGVGRGVALTLGCALAFAVNILEIDRAVAGPAPVDAVALTAVQLAVVGAGSLVPGAFLGGYRMPAAAWAAALYTGLAASAVAFGLQVWGQRRVGPTRTSLLLMVEPVTAAFIGWVTGSRLGPLGAVGAILILGGIAVAETTPKGLFRSAPTADTDTYVVAEGTAARESGAR
ncbi:MAG TPA: DMT family transporter [Acidimicrobiales bacterium]|nr:DMT family transporter [Acidimicrobiales bacterium]